MTHQMNNIESSLTSLYAPIRQCPPSLFIVSGPSGVGKTTLIHSVSQKISNLKVSVSYTTRPKRPAEQDGFDYHFINQNTFRDMEAHGFFLEDAPVLDNLYGTSKKEIIELQTKGYDVVLTIDWQGAKQIKQQFDDVISIFILPPSLNALSQRLRDRHQDNEETIEKRIKKAREMISHWKEYDYIIINDQFEEASDNLCSIVQVHRLGRNRQECSLRSLIEDLLG